MLSPAERAQIKAELERLEQARKACDDEGIQKVIESWIKQQKQKLASQEKSK
jgi:hypothetical protein